jgi:hypothetical protein
VKQGRQSTTEDEKESSKEEKKNITQKGYA